jgi:hypothetical protein
MVGRGGNANRGEGEKVRLIRYSSWMGWTCSVARSTESTLEDQGWSPYIRSGVRVSLTNDGRLLSSSNSPRTSTPSQNPSPTSIRLPRRHHCTPTTRSIEGRHTELRRGLRSCTCSCRRTSAMVDGTTPITVPPAEVTCVKAGCGTKMSSSSYKCPTCQTVQK